MIQLEINNEFLDVEKNSISVVYQVNEVGKLESRKASHTNSFKLPRTLKNEELFDRLGVFGNTSEKPYQKIRANLKNDSQYLLKNGLLSIEKTDADYYHTRLYDGVVGLKTILDKPLDEIRSNEFERIIFMFDQYVEYPKTRDYIEKKSGVVYVHDDFTLSNKPLTDLEIPDIFNPNERFSVFLHTIIELMFEQSGLRLVSNFFDTDYFKAFIIPRYIVSTFPYPELFAGMSQYDFLIGVCKMFGLVFRLENDGSYRFERIEDTMNNAEDWSDKFVRKISEKYNQGSYEEVNNFKMSYKSGDPHNRDWAITVDNVHNLGGEKDFLTLPFNARTSAPNGTFKGTHWWDLGDTVDNRTIMFLNRRDAEIEIGGQGYPETFNIGVPTINNTIPHNLIRDNYLTLAKTLNRGESVEIDFDLNDIDINNLDFFKAKYIKQLGGNYYLQRIKGYTPDKVARCEMLRIDYHYPYDNSDISKANTDVIPNAKIVPDNEFNTTTVNHVIGVANGIPSTDPQGLALDYKWELLNADGIFEITAFTNGGKRIEWRLDFGIEPKIHDVEIKLTVTNSLGYSDIAIYRCYTERT